MRLPGLDVVLGRSAPAVEVLVERLGLSTSEIGDDEAGVGPLSTDLDPRDDALDAAPAGGAVNELLEPSDLARLRRRSHGECRVKGFLQVHRKFPSVIFSVSKAELVRMTRPVSIAGSNSHTVAVRDGCTMIPLACGKGSGGQDHSSKRHLKPCVGPVRPPGSARIDRSWEISELVDRHCHAVFITLPSMTTPAVTYFHSATSSFRASATMALFFMRPPFDWTRPLNQRLSADSG
jgi:hypothetical protein